MDGRGSENNENSRLVAERIVLRRPFQSTVGSDVKRRRGVCQRRELGWGPDFLLKLK